MNTSLAKKLMIAESPIFYNNIEYSKIQALTFKKTERGIEACAELLDRNSNSVITAFLKDIKINKNLEKKDIDIDEIYFQGLESEFKRNCLSTIGGLGVQNYKHALIHLRGILNVISDLEETLEKKVNIKEEKENK